MTAQNLASIWSRTIYILPKAGAGCARLFILTIFMLSCYVKCDEQQSYNHVTLFLRLYIYSLCQNFHGYQYAVCQKLWLEKRNTLACRCAILWHVTWNARIELCKRLCSFKCDCQSCTVILWSRNCVKPSIIGSISVNIITLLRRLSVLNVHRSMLLSAKSEGTCTWYFWLLLICLLFLTYIN